MARPVIKRGPEITPRRRAVIVAYRTLNQSLSYKAIKEKIGVLESTGSGIFRHAVKNATAKRVKESQHVLSVAPVATAEPEEFLAGINAELQALQIAETDDNYLLPTPVEEAQSASEVELSLSELISKDCLDPDARTGRVRALNEEENDRLVATVKRDFNTRRMKLVDLRREAGLSHV